MTTISEHLGRVLARGVSDGRTQWAVHRAWPADLADPGQGHVLELVAADGRVAGGRLRQGAVELVLDDPALPALAGLVADGWRILAHRPGKRAVLRRGDTGAYRKLATTKATARAARRAEAVEGLLAVVPAVPRPPVRLAVDRAGGMLDLAPAPGDSLRYLLTDPATEDTRAESVGRRLGQALLGLAALDPTANPAPELPTHTLADEADVLERWVTSAAALAPLAAGDLDELRREAAQTATALRGTEALPPALAHRDLHDGQVLVSTGDDLTLLDWDTAAWADPCLDTANLLAHLDLLTTRVPDARSRVAALCSGLDDVLREGGHPASADPDRLALLRRGTAIRIRAVHAFRP